MCMRTHNTTYNRPISKPPLFPPKKLDGAANYAYDIGFQLGCTLYVARYKSAYDYVPPQALAPNSRVNVRPEKHWLHVFLPPDRNLEMRIVSVSGLGNECHENTAASSTEPLLAGTILPVSLDATIRSDKNRIGDRISATLMQDVPLRSDGISLPKGSTVSGRVVEVVRQGQGSDESRISIQFDQLRFRDRTVPVTTNLRALASAMAVSASQTPRAGNEDSSDWNLVPIGGDQASYGQGGLVVQGSEVVGKSTGQGTFGLPHSRPWHRMPQCGGRQHPAPGILGFFIAGMRRVFIWGPKNPALWTYRTSGPDHVDFRREARGSWQGQWDALTGKQCWRQNGVASYHSIASAGALEDNGTEKSNLGLRIEQRPQLNGPANKRPHRLLPATAGSSGPR